MTTSETAIPGDRSIVQPLPPSRQTLARLSVRDRDTMMRILSEAHDFVTHPMFAEAGLEDQLFGAEYERVRPWCNAAEVPAALPTDGEGSRRHLTASDEQWLFLQLNFARQRVRRILDAAAARPLDADEAGELLKWHYRAEAARIRIIQENMPLVLAMAKRARLGNIDYAELISEGNMALLRSVDKFDCSRGFKFSTYACRAILKSFSRVAIRTSRYRCRFPTEFDPSLERSDYLELHRDALEDSCVHELKDILMNNRADLSDVERRVLAARFALDGDPDQASEPKTLEQVGVMIGVTKERVRQIQNKAMAKLKAALEESILAA